MDLNSKNIFNPGTLFIFSLILLFIFIRYIIGFNGLYGQDSHEYYRYSRAIVDFFKTGNSPGNYFFPIYYPVFGAISGLVINNLFSLQLISTLSLSGSLFILYKVMISIYVEKKYLAVYLAITFLFAPYVFRNSFVVMSDMLSVFFITASFYFFMDCFRKPGSKQIILFSTFSALAVLTRYAAAVVLFVPLILVIYDIFKRKNYLHLLIPAFTAIILSVPMLLINQTILTELSKHEFLQEWSVKNFFVSNFVTEQGTQYNRFPNIINSLSSVFLPTYLVFGLVLIVLSERNLPNNRYWTISIIIVAVYALFLSGIPFQNHRYLLLAYPFVVVVLFAGFERLVKILNLKKVWKYPVLSSMLFIQIFFCIYFFRTAVERNKLEREIAIYINKTNCRAVYAFDTDVSFSSYDVDKNVFNLWKEMYSKFEISSLVIFNEEKFKVQWAGKNPMLNWNNLKANYNLIEKQDFGNGWKAYEIHSMR